MRKTTLNRRLLAIALLFLLSASTFLIHHRLKEDTLFVGHNEEEKEDAAENPEARLAYEFEMLKDPATGLIPEGIHEQELAQATRLNELNRSLRTMGVNAYAFQGPENLGGRTRAVAYDRRFNGTTNRVILAGGVSGGIFKSSDNGATWTRTSPLNQLFSVTCLAQDPRPGFEDTWYYGTGEAIGNSAGAGNTALYMGNGLYKSTDNGETWTRLPSSNTTSLESFNARQDYITRVIVDPDGVVYFAAIDGIYRSADGGTSWTAVLTSGAGGINTGMVTDIVCTSTSPARLYASFSGTTNASPTNVPGVWTSATGLSGSWTKIAGATAASSPAGWNANGTYRRVVLALAPSNENTLYALYDNGAANPAIEAELYRWNQLDGSWTDLSANLPDEAGGNLSGNDPFAVQGGYNLVIAVKPDDANVVFIGGTNIYRSTDGWTTPSNYARIGGYVSNLSYGLWPNSHPDIHAIVFQPNNSNILLCGNDGGVQRTTDPLATSVSWTDISNGFRTYQYYHVALDPRIGNPKVIGGAQDNGTTRNIGGNGVNFEMVISGDGVSVGLSDVISGATYEYGGAQNGTIYRRNSTSSPGFVSNIRPAAALDAGLFVTLFRLDNDNTQYLYYASDSSLYRNTAAASATTGNWTQMTGVQTGIVDGLPNGKTRLTVLTTSRGTYDPATSSLFMGTNDGKVFRLDDPANAPAAATPVNITGAGFPAAANVSSIAVNPRNDDTVLVTFSNYGVTSVFWTGNANAASPTWHNVEGSFTLPSFRSSMITLSNGRVEYFVGTSVGLYMATIDGSNPSATNWVQEGTTSLGNAVVSSLAYRPSDGKLLVGTHGSGMWTTTLSMIPLPVSLLQFDALAEGSNVKLNWATSWEQNSLNYEVERSADGTNFQRIGTVGAAGNSSMLQRYQYLDGQPLSVGYYRLKMNDRDGQSRYSRVAIVRLTSTQQGMQVLENPVGQQIRLRFNRRYTQLQLQLFTSNGALVAERQFRNGTELSWSLPSSQRSGVYILRAIADGEVLTANLLVR
jgi:hypothetical protein